MTPLLPKMFRQPEGELPAPVGRHAGLRDRLDTRAPVESASFAVFDTELTGLDFKRDSIISIGAVRMKGGRIYPGRKFYRLVRPASELRDQGVLVHEITHTELAGAAEPHDALEAFVDFVDDAVLVGHFAFIDVNFVDRAMNEHFGLSLQSPVVDTAALLEWLSVNDPRFAREHPPPPRRDLFSLAGHYGIEIEKAHNALYDAYITAQLFQRFLYYLPDAGIRTVGHLIGAGRG